MTAKTGLIPSGSSNCYHWKSDQSGTQILFFRGFTQGELMRFFYSPKTKSRDYTEFQGKEILFRIK